VLLFIWDEENIQHIARHNVVEPFEAEDALMDPQCIKFSAHSGNMGIMGSSEDGRQYKENNGKNMSYNRT
jgi:hypothetical protein